MRSPILLYRLRLGWVLGAGFLLLEHTGRTTGLRRQVVLERLLRPDADHIVVASGFGRRAQWYRNVETDPAVRITTGRHRDRPAVAELLSRGESAALLRDAVQQHDHVLRRLTEALTAAAPGGDVDVRLVRLRLLPLTRVRRPCPARDTGGRHRAARTAGRCGQRSRRVVGHGRQERAGSNVTASGRTAYPADQAVEVVSTAGPGDVTARPCRPADMPVGDAADVTATRCRTPAQPGVLLDADDVEEDSMSRSRTFLLLALVTTTLEAGLSYGHALQARGKRELPPEQLMRFQTRVLAPYRLGAGLPEAVAMATSAAATWGARHDRRTARRSAAALAATCAAFATWAVGIEPVNRRLSTWDDRSPQQAVPPDWAALRDRWHSLHAARLVLLGVGAAAAAAALSEPAG